jgi:glycosyltransferase involved in cell wall biosynthesis/LmbE family N-acetylglucosaminyl deacetylase
MENKLIPYQATQCISANSVVVFAPHPDDEVFGCGGAILRHVAANVPVQVVIVSDGAFGVEGKEKAKIIAEREAESRKAAIILGYGEPEFWHLPDRGVIYGEALVQRIMDKIQLSAANLVYAPSLLEMHPDHRALGMCVIEAVRRASSRPTLAMYEVGVPLPPNLLLDISDLAESKMAAMECFVSQNKQQRYDLDIAALNRYRTYTLPAEVTAAEAYTLVSAEELANDPFKLYQSEHQRQRELGLTLDIKDVPLVSVIIRSMDRPTLSEALDSVALQTYANIEVVVVNAKGGEHSLLGDWCGNFQLRIIDSGESLRRSRAGNVGLNNARGDYLIFLDDDDWFMPEHISLLIDALTRNPDKKVAYSGVTGVNEQKQPIGNNFCQAYDRTLLLAGNYIPIHAVLFSRSLLDSGCLMDESLDLYEDWDFWLQAATYGDFLFVNNFSAYYRIGGKSGQGVRPDTMLAREVSGYLFKKWHTQWRPDDLLNIMDRVRGYDTVLTHCDAVTADRDAVATYCDAVVADRDALVVHCDAVTADRDAVATYCDAVVADRDAVATYCDAVIAERDLQIATLNQALVERGAIIDEMLSSSSWRITYSLRALKTFIVAVPSYLNRQKTLPKQLDVAWYMRQNPIVAQSNMDAHEHYALFGKAEHRQPAPDLFIIRNTNRLKLIAKVSPIAVKRLGGIRKATQRTLKVVKQEGLEGLRSRLIQYNHLQKQPLPPGTPSSCIILDKQQRYCLSKETTDYTYIPLRQPDNLTTIIASMEQQPVFSIIVPVYNTPPELLTKLLNSVTSQWYPHWQLILADDASPSTQIQDDLAKINHPRIIVLSLPKNKGIAGATNVALDRATGEFVVLLDHDDELTDDCLFELARCINRENPDYIYSDEDKIRPDGQFCEPHFKPDWSPDTLMSTMYVCHVSCIRRSLLEAVDGLRSDYDGCQDWDLMLRLTEKTDRISHIAKVLYHWRIIPASTAADIAAKPYVLDASRRVREDTLHRRGLMGTVEPVKQMKGYFRVNYHLQGDPLISIIIPSRDNSDILRRCLDSIIEQSSYRNFELIIIDNGSVEPTMLIYLDQLKTQANTTVIRHDAPFNFSELNNIGANIAKGDILLFLNDDTEVISTDWLERMGGYAQLTHVGAVGAKLLYPGGNQIQHAGVLNLEDGPNHAFLRQDPDTPGYYMRNLLEYNWLAVTGACLMIERTKFQSIGGFDETFPIAYNDIDLCLCLRNAELYNVVCQAVRLIHHESVSRGLDDLSAVKRARLQQEKRHLFDKHPHYFQYDPFHNPNLHPNGIHFEVTR